MKVADVEINIIKLVFPPRKAKTCETIIVGWLKKYAVHHQPDCNITVKKLG